MLSASLPRSPSTARRWRTPLSLGVGVPFLLGSSPAAAAGSSGFLVGGVTTWFGLLAALSTLVAPRRGGDVAGAAAVLALGAVAVVAWGGLRRRGVRAQALAAAGGDAGVVGFARVGAVSAATTTRNGSRPLPAALDCNAVLEAARTRFLGLQAAWDAGDVQTLGRFTTPDMLQELLPVLSSRTGGTSRTDVVTLHAELLEVAELGAAWLACVVFSGLIRESTERGAVPFRELWMLAAAKDGALSWRLARQQALL